MTFTTQKLTGQRVLVKGTDGTGTDGQTVLDSTQWDNVLAHSEYSQAEDDYKAVVEEFFAPLTAAAEAVGKKLAPAPDPDSFVVYHEGVDGVDAKPAVVVQLDHDSIVLRILESYDTSRLVWVGDELEVLAQASVADTSVTVDDLSGLNDN